MMKNIAATASHFFTIRIWRDELGNGQIEWRGKVLHVTSGDARYFRDWQMLLAFLAAQVQDNDSIENSTGSEIGQSNIP